MITPEMAAKDAQALKSMQGPNRRTIAESVSSDASHEAGSSEDGGSSRS